MNMKKIAAACVAAAMAVSLAACSGGVNIDSLTLEAPPSVEVGETVQLSVDYGSTAEGVTEEAIAEAAQKVELTWTSSDEAVATVDDTGLVTGVAAGEAEITAAIPDTEVSTSCTVTVTPPIEGVEAPESMELEIGGEDSKSLEAKLIPDGAVGAELTYSSSDESVATVDENGVVTAVSNGECVITTTATKPVEVPDEDVAESAESNSGVESASESTSSAVSESTAPESTSTAESTPESAVSASESASDASSTAADVETEEAPMMEANVQTWTAETTVTVTTAAEGITLSQNSGSLYVGSSANVSVYTTPEEASAAVASEVTYTSSDESVATVAGTTEGAAGFTVTGEGTGTATITVEYRGLTAEYEVTVPKYVAPSRPSTSSGSGNTGSGSTTGGGTTPTQPSGGGTTPAQPSGGGTTPTPPPSQPSGGGTATPTPPADSYQPITNGDQVIPDNVPVGPNGGDAVHVERP